MLFLRAIVSQVKLPNTGEKHSTRVTQHLRSKQTFHLTQPAIAVLLLFVAISSVSFLPPFVSPIMKHASVQRNTVFDFIFKQICFMSHRVTADYVYIFTVFLELCGTPAQSDTTLGSLNLFSASHRERSSVACSSSAFTRPLLSALSRFETACFHK